MSNYYNYLAPETLLNVYQRLAEEMSREKLPEKFIATIPTGWWPTGLGVLPEWVKNHGQGRLCHWTLKQQRAGRQRYPIALAWGGFFCFRKPGAL